MRLERRIADLESRTDTGRCPTCWTWRPNRIEYPDGYSVAPRSLAAQEQPPRQCPTCGWEPRLIQLHYRDVED